MTKRGVAAAVVALIAALGICGAASAQAQPLKKKDARKLALKLARKQVRAHELAFFQLGPAKRSGSDRVVFAYQDRRAGVDVFCTAHIVVTRRVTGRRTLMTARFRGPKCQGMPADVVAVETATRNAARAVNSNTAETTSSLDAVSASVKRCRKLDVPRSRRTAVAAVLDTALGEALERPNDTALGDFVTALSSISATHSTLKAAIAGWADYVAAVRSLPSIPDPCAALKDWAQKGWAASDAPLDLAAYRAVSRRTATDSRAIERGSRLLARSGVFPRAVLQFTPEGLLLHLLPDGL